jgi:hypothetical protein
MASPKTVTARFVRSGLINSPRPPDAGSQNNFVGGVRLAWW